MIESLHSHHIRTARALGLSDFSVVVKHAMRGAMLPIVSYAGPAAASLLTGSVIVETIFSIPGVGRYFVEAALNRDYTLVMGTVVVIAHIHRDCSISLSILFTPLLIHGCAMTDVAAPLSPKPGRSLWADAWARLKANQAAMVSAYFLSSWRCLHLGPWFTPHQFTTIYQDYNRMPPSLSAYPKPEMLDLAVNDAVRRCGCAGGMGREGRQDIHHRHLRQTHRRAHDPLHRPLQRV